MNKITLGFFLAKSKTTIKGLLVLFALFFMNAQVSWGQTQLAGWTFDTTSAAPNTPSSITANLGTQIGTAAIYANGTNGSSTWITSTSGNELTVFAGSTTNDPRGVSVLAGLSYCPVGGTLLSSNGKAMVIKFSMSGFQDPILTFAARQSGTTAYTTYQFAWSTDGITFTNFGSNIAPTSTTFTTKTLDLSTINSVDGAGTVYLRVTFTGTTNATSNNRLDNILINATSVSTTWYGTSWSNGAPTASLDAIIAGDYSVAANITAKTLTVNNSAIATIPSGNNVTVTGAVTVTAPATLTFSNNANLIQDPATTTNSNVGVITVKRNSSPLLLYDYTLWSSPVASQNLAAFSPLTSLSPNRFYIYDSASDQYTNTVPVTLDPTTTNFTPGAGFLIRMPNTADAVTPTTYPGVFTGVPNNGDVPFTLSTAGGGYNLVGNPYPSPITMTQFVADNAANISGTLYFWRKTNGVANPLGGSAYCTWAGGTYTTNNNAQSVDPAGIIQTGQGFFVQTSAPGSVTFKNTQRVANTTGQFFKTKQVATSSRIWLNATTVGGDFSQMAVNYTDDATLGVDLYDGKYINDSPIALTSNINNGEYTIQGRPAFDVTDVVALNFKTDVAGDYTIAIDHSEGVFASGQDIYLVDSKTGAETNLKTGSYTFTAASGVDNARFSLKYQKTLKVDDVIFNENNVTVYAKNGSLYVNSGTTAINTIQVYDVQGRLVAERKNVKATTATLDNLKANNQVLLVKVVGENNQAVTKKVVN